MCYNRLGVEANLRLYHPQVSIVRNGDHNAQNRGRIARSFVDSLRQAGAGKSPLLSSGRCFDRREFLRGHTMSRKHYRIIADAIGTIADNAARSHCGRNYGRLSRPIVRQIRPGALSPSLRGGE